MRAEAAFVLCLVSAAAGELSGQARTYPLNCRGGAGLAFDTIIVVPDSDRVRLWLTFAASPAAAGPEGQGLQPGTCAWVDRGLTDGEPRRIQLVIGTSDSTPARSVRDSSEYWGFLAYNSDSGYINAPGYRHWHASSPPIAPAAPAPTAMRARGFPLPFDIRYLPLLAVAWLLVAWAPMLIMTGRWSNWRRLADLYPDQNSGRGTSFRTGQMVMRLTVYRGGARLTTDGSHLHFAMSPFMRPGHQPFSVPWSDIHMSRDGWPWFPLKGRPVVRLSLAQHPDLRILVQVRDGERIVAGSAGQLALDDPRELVETAHR